MNDDVKAAIERFHTWEFDGLDARDHATLLAHIDGEPARTAAAREEQRAADVARSRKAKYALTGGKTSLAGAWNAGIESAIEGVESMPLTATPLADEIAFLKKYRDEREAYWLEREAKWIAERDSYADGSKFHADRAEKAEADGDEKETERAALETALMAFKARFAEVLAERDALRAQVEAARTYARQSLDYGEDCDATDLLAAMDEAKP
jgi:hypothetical protein